MADNLPTFRPRRIRPINLIIAFMSITVLTLAVTFVGVVLTWLDGTLMKDADGFFRFLEPIAQFSIIGMGLTALSLIIFAILPYRILAICITAACGLWILAGFVIYSNTRDRMQPYHLAWLSIAGLMMFGLCLLLYLGRSRLWVQG